jgi:hypothetical protein
MKRYRPAALLVLLLTFLSVHAETLTGRVVRVTDGDTIVVLDSSKVQHKELKSHVINVADPIVRILTSPA